jgi:hypothetical protein
MTSVAAPRSSIQWSTKGDVLVSLQARIDGATVLDSFIVTLAQWRDQREALLLEFRAASWAGEMLIVRSSARCEDTVVTSNAGRFLTVADVALDDVAAAIDAVFASYGIGRDDDQVLVQPMVRNVVGSGVACSVDPTTGAPVRVINLTRGPGTDGVTSGAAREVETWYLASAEAAPSDRADLRGLLAVIAELEVMFDARAIELEFAWQESGALVLLQVRPIAAAMPQVDAAAYAGLMDQVATQIQAASGGRTTVFSTMTDWNPAEIIGTRPRPLARTLYEYLVTNGVWADARRRYGYRRPDSDCLMVNFAGMPYIDVRTSLTSLIPAALSDGAALELADAYVDRLIAQPELHDKVEFAVAVSCYAFDVEERLAGLSAQGVTSSTIDALRIGLREQTQLILRGATTWRQDLRALDILGARSSREAASPLAAVRDGLHDCRRFGTRPFAGLARAAFIGTEMLWSLTRIGVLEPADVQQLVAGADTVTTQLQCDFASMSPQEFLSVYGHLRPGTYDLTSPRYDAAPDMYFDWSDRRPMPSGVTEVRPPTAGVQRALERLDLGVSADALLDFAVRAIRAREFAKFRFTARLSGVLEEVARMGAGYGFSRDDMAFVDVATLLRLSDSSQSIADTLRAAVDVGRVAHAETLSLTLPPVIMSPGDARGFVLGSALPNFVTLDHVVAPIADVASGEDPAGKIACIRAADPGYDWLFARGIVGLITAYGGSNSHMSVRCLEQGIPAAVGLGERAFDALCTGTVVELDARNRRVQVVQ